MRLPLAILLAAASAVPAIDLPVIPRRPGEPRWAPSGPAPERPAIERLVLANGLQVLLEPDPGVPLVGVSVAWRAGAADDPAGRPGLAALAQRVLRTATAGDGRELLEAVRAAGDRHAELFPRRDVTVVRGELPSAHLGALLAVEAARLTSFERVGEARLRGVAGDADGRAKEHPGSEALAPERAARPWLPLPLPASAFTLAEVKAFGRSRFGVSNAVLSIAGGFEPAAAKKLVQELLGALPASPPAPRLVAPAPPAPPGRNELSREVIWETPTSPSRVELVWRTAAAGTADDAVLLVATQLLGDVLEQRLARKHAVEALVSAGQRSGRNGSEWILSVKADDPATLAVREKALREALEGYLLEQVPPAHVERGLAALRAELKARRLLPSGRAGHLAELAALGGPADEPARWLERFEGTGPDDFSRALRAQLQQAPHAIVRIVTTARAPESGRLRR